MSHDPHSSSSNSSQNAPSTWTEPPWCGWIETTGDALLILEAARRGLIPRVTRRLVDSERKMITSGSVFVFDEDESGIKRWTDGFFWSPSRILGNFLLYRETEKRGAGHRSARAERETNCEEPPDVKVEGTSSLSRPKSEASRLGIDRMRERSLVGSLTNSYKFKPGGMMKKTFSLTIGGVAQHLISYYKVEDVEQGRLRAPSSLPELASLDISPEYLDKTHFRNPPKVEIGVDGIPRYRGEADDVDTSPHLLTSPLAISPGYDDPSTSSGKRGKASRYDPYSNQSGSKRSRKGKAASSSRSSNNNNTDTDTEPTSPTYPSPVHQPAPGYPETSLSATTNHYSAPYPYYPYPASYSPAPYAPPAPAPVSPIQPPQQSPTPPQHASPTPHPQLTYPGYASDSHQPASATSPTYPYYQPQGYSNYMWPPYSYGQSQQGSHAGPSSSGSQERASRAEQEEGDDGT